MLPAFRIIQYHILVAWIRTFTFQYIEILVSWCVWLDSNVKHTSSLRSLYSSVSATIFKRVLSGLVAMEKFIVFAYLKIWSPLKSKNIRGKLSINVMVCNIYPSFNIFYSSQTFILQIELQVQMHRHFLI